MAHVTFPMPSDVRAYLIVNCLVQVLALLVVAGRIASRTIRKVRLGWDDFLIVAALPQGLALVILQGITSSTGSGYHLSAAIMPNLSFILKLNLALELVYLAALGTVKMSILAFYLRLFSRGTTMRLVIYFTMALVALWVLCHAEAALMICQPLAAQWDTNIKNGVCGNRIHLFESIIITNILIDVVILAMPLYTVWKLDIRASDKVGLSACFLTGVAVIIVAIARIVYVTSVDVAADITGTMALTVFLAAFEPNLAIICACIPMLRPLYARCRTLWSTSPAITVDQDATTDLSGSRSPGSRGTDNELKELELPVRVHTRSAEAAQEEARPVPVSHQPWRNSQMSRPSSIVSGGDRLSVVGPDGPPRADRMGVTFGATPPLNHPRRSATPKGPHVVGTSPLAMDDRFGSLESGSEAYLTPRPRQRPLSTLSTGSKRMSTGSKRLTITSAYRWMVGPSL